MQKRTNLLLSNDTGSHCSRFHPNRFTFCWVMAVTGEDHFCFVEYLQYRRFAPITNRISSTDKQTGILQYTDQWSVSKPGCSAMWVDNIMTITHYIHTQWTGSAEPSHNPDSQLNAWRVSSYTEASTDLNSLILQTLTLVNINFATRELPIKNNLINNC